MLVHFLHHGVDGLAGADELSSEELSDLAMLAASVAARPSALAEDDSGNDALYAASNMQRSTRLQTIFNDFKGKPNHVVVSGPSPLGSPLLQVMHRHARLHCTVHVMPEAFIGYFVLLLRVALLHCVADV